MKDSDVTARATGATPIGSADEEFMRLVIRETSDTYRTPAERAAYRAGMSTSAWICDSVSAEIGKQRKHLTLKQMAARDAATKCADDISKMRDLVGVYDGPRGLSAADEPPSSEGVTS